MELVKDIIVVLIVIIGVLTIGYGFYLAWQPLGYIVGGGLLLTLALLIDKPLKIFKGGDNN